MPLEKLERISSTRIVAYWKITEDEATLGKLFDATLDSTDALSTLKAPNKRLEWLAARILVKSLMVSLGSQYCGISKNRDGKPLLNGSDFELSITHSYPYVAAIIDTNTSVGIDLEQPKEKLLRVAHKFLSESELATANNNITKICILWSAKEALYKIYSKRGLTFSKHLPIKPFELAPFGMITGSIDTEDWQKSYKLQYTVHKDFVLVFNVN